MGRIIDRRRVMGGEEKLVWVSFSMLKGTPTFIESKNNLWRAQYNHIPIYALAATYITQRTWTCRINVGVEPLEDAGDSELSALLVGRRFWLTGDHTNRVEFLTPDNLYSTGWLSYDKASWESNQSITLYDGNVVNDVYLYYSNDPNKISPLDKEGACVVYLNFYQAKAHLDNYYAQIKQSDLDIILNS